MSTIGSSISRVRNVLKAVKEDPFITDRFLWSLIQKHGDAILHQHRAKNSMRHLSSHFETLPCIDLIEVDKIEACCGDLQSGCTIMRSKEPIPEPMEGPSGPLFRTLSSIDGSQELYRTEPRTYVSMTKTSNFKFNKQKYYWYVDGHLYLPDVEWEGVRVEAMWKDDISHLQCETSDQCILRQDQKTSIPDELFAPIEQLVLQELGVTVQLPPDEQDDKKNILR